MRLSDLEAAAVQYWQHLDSPLAKVCIDKARSGDWEGILKLKLDPNSYVSSNLLLRDTAAVTFLKKNPFVRGSSPKQRASVALENWKKGEAACYHTNQRLARYLPGVGIPADGLVQHEFFELVRETLWNWMGDPPSDGEVQDRARHGPGTTFSSLVADPTVADKLSEKATLTGNAVYHLVDLMGTMWGREIALRYTHSYLDCVDVVRGDRFATAPKDALRDRSIVIGPSINTYFQLGVGGCARHRMKTRLGWDLNVAADVHREMARIASIDGKQSTIDLVNASDSNCKNLVRVLFGHPVYLKRDPWYYSDLSRPHHDPYRLRRWLERFEDLRTTHTRVDGKWHLLEKFSGMGNGYTFELETIVFAAISSVCLKLKGHAGELGKDLFVFGDDIIVPTDASSLVIDALRFCGFETNKEKTFTTGFFRESCGGDFFHGRPVRGFYFKRGLNAPDDYFSLYNGSQKVFDRCSYGIRPGFADWVLRGLPTHLRKIGGHARFGDSVLHGVCPRYKWKDGIRWVQIVKWDRPRVIPWKFFCDDVRLASQLITLGEHPWGISSRGGAPGIELIWVSDS